MMLPPAETEQPDDRDPRGLYAAIASALFVIAVVAGAAAKWGWW